MRLSCFENRIGELRLVEMKLSCFENRIGELRLAEMKLSEVAKPQVNASW